MKAGSRPDRQVRDGPLITVGVFAYNHQDFVRSAAQSVLDSTYQAWELFVVDDGSADSTAATAETWAAEVDDPRVHVLADGANRGLAARLNEVVGQARGEWLAVLGGDDFYLPQGIERLVSGTQSDVDVVWGDLEVIDAQGNPKGYARPRDTWQGPTARRYRSPASPGVDILRVNNFISGTSPLVRLSALRSVGGYTPDVRNEDLDLWLRLGLDRRFKYVDATVAAYRVVPGSSSRSEASAVMDQARIVARLLDQNLYPREGLAHLLAMRWLLAVARAHGRPPVSIAALTEASGLRRDELMRRMPRAGWDPVAMSAAAALRRMVRS